MVEGGGRNGELARLPRFSNCAVDGSAAEEVELSELSVGVL